MPGISFMPRLGREMRSPECMRGGSGKSPKPRKQIIAPKEIVFVKLPLAEEKLCTDLVKRALAKAGVQGSSLPKGTLNVMREIARNSHPKRLGKVSRKNPLRIAAVELRVAGMDSLKGLVRNNNLYEELINALIREIVVEFGKPVKKA